MRTTLFVLAAIFVVTEAGVAFPGWLQRRNSQCPGGNPTDGVMACIAPLEQFENMAEGFPLGSVETQEALDFLCGEMEEVKDCVVDVHRGCGQENMHARIMKETVEGVVGHICSDDGKQVLLSETQCWENEAVEDVGEECIKEYARNSQNPCQIVRDVRRCVKSKVTSYCNPRAATFMDGLFYQAIKPVATHMLGCNVQLRLSRSIMKMLSFSRK